jgi:hypothetical protein
LSQLGEARYGKMNMGHVGSPHCTLAHILVFFFCVATGIWYLPVGRWGASFFYQRGRFLNWYQLGTYFWLFEKTAEFVVLNICERVPVDVSILVTWRVVAFTVASEARVCQNLEIGGLPSHFALSSLPNFHGVAVFFHLL